jgi:hypothetical protein
VPREPDSRFAAGALASSCLMHASQCNFFVASDGARHRTWHQFATIEEPEGSETDSRGVRYFRFL